MTQANTTVSDERVELITSLLRKLAYEHTDRHMDQNAEDRIEWEAADALIQLSALRATADVTELVWLKSNAGERWTAQYPFGQFEITRAIYRGHEGPSYTWHRGICSEHFETLEEAKSAVQSDYASRVRAALSQQAPE
jgi:hypothetical protein